MASSRISTSLSKRLVAWVLALLPVILPSTSLEVRYHCRVSGARDLTACCCTGENDCTPEATDCGAGGCGTTAGPSIDGCGCCDVTVEERGTELASALSQETRSGAHACGVALLPVRLASLAPTAPTCLHLATRAEPATRSGPPLYLRHGSLLI